MERTRRASRQAQRRRLIADALDRLGVALCVALALGLGIVIVSRALGEPVNWRWAIAPPVALGLIAALAVAWRRRLTPLEAATDLDTTLKLRDRMGSSIELDELNRDDPFVQLLEFETEQQASKIRVAQATPIRLDNSWLLWPALAALCVGAILFMPTLDLLGRQQARQQQAQKEEQVQTAAQTIDDLIDQTKEQLAELEDAAADDELEETLREIRERLQNDEISPEEALTQAAAAMDEKSRQLEEQAAEAQQTNEMLEEMLAASADPNNLDASDLEKALESGDFESAAAELDKLREQLDQMSEEERQALSVSMQDMARRLSEAAQNKQAQNDAAQRAAEQLQQMGLSKEQAERLARSADAQEIAEQLRQQGIDPESAQRLAEQMARQQQDAQRREGAARSAESLAKAMEQASEGAGQGDGGQMQALGDQLGELSDAELDAQLAQLASGQMSEQAQGMMRNNDAGVGGQNAGEGSRFNEQFPTGLGKSLTEDVENRRGGEGEVAMRYTRDRPTQWDDGASDAPMRAARIREAAPAAERAVEQQSVSPRYRKAIREYFERAQRVAPPAETSAPADPAPPSDEVRPDTGDSAGDDAGDPDAR